MKVNIIIYKYTVIVEIKVQYVWTCARFFNLK